MLGNLFVGYKYTCQKHILNDFGICRDKLLTLTFGCLHHVDVGGIAHVSKVYGA
jgi:hypothetical protein